MPYNDDINLIVLEVLKEFELKTNKKINTYFDKIKDSIITIPDNEIIDDIKKEQSINKEEIFERNVSFNKIFEEIQIEGELVNEKFTKDGLIARISFKLNNMMFVLKTTSDE